MAVSLAGVSKVYGRGGSAVRALDQVTLTTVPGEFTCLIGASGCGKSTLLSLVAGLDRPTSGEITVNGRATARRAMAGAGSMKSTGQGASSRSRSISKG